MENSGSVKLTGFGIPWTALGPKSLFSDSGFLLIYEVLTRLYEQFGSKSLIALDPRFEEIFEPKNDPAKTGVWAVYNDGDRIPQRSYDAPLSPSILNAYLSTGLTCPVDFVFTNKRLSACHYALSCDDRFSRYRVPLYLQPTTAGKEGFKNPIAPAFTRQLQMEAASYMMARRVIWPTPEQRDRGMKIAKRFLSHAVVREIKETHRVIGGGITDLIRPYRLSDKDVCNRLQTSQKKFRVSFVGRTNSVKNITFIIDTLKTLFAKYDIALEVVSLGGIELAQDGYKRVTDVKDAMNVIGHHETGGTKGRDYYAGTILPGIQCGISATLTECHPATPREAIYVGVPWLIPSNRAWGPSLFGREYPFLYNGEDECIALIKRIRNGKITDEECERFNKIRNDPAMIQFMSYTAEKIYQLAIEDSQEFVNFTKDHSFSKITTAWEKWVKVGGEFTWGEIHRAVARLGGGSVSDRPHARSHFDVYTRLRERIECINPKDGVFRRVK